MRSDNSLPCSPAHSSCTGFDYHFNAIQNEENELFNAYKDMFEIAVSQSRFFRQLLTTYVPIYERLFVGFLSRLPNSADHGIVRRGDTRSASGSEHNQSCSQETHPREEAENPGG